MNPNNVWKKNREFYIGVAGTVLEGLLSGSCLCCCIPSCGFYGTVSLI